MPSTNRKWVASAVKKLQTDMQRTGETNLIRLEISAEPGISLYLKDESTHPTGSLKHRLARSMFFNALCSGWINRDTVIVEASSGSTAVSEAYFAKLLGLRFIAVVPKTTSAEKIAQIEIYGGECHFVDRVDEVYEASRKLADRHGGWYMDQFTFAERVTDWKSDASIVSAILQQMRNEEYPIPEWIVCGAGTGGTSATVGRYLRYHGLSTGLCLADPEGSVFHRSVKGEGAVDNPIGGSLIEGIGRARLEPSFLPNVIDRAIPVADVTSIAAARALSRRLGRDCGGSTGTNLVAAAILVSEMIDQGIEGSVVTILCDSGDRYRSTLYDQAWLNTQKIHTGSIEGDFRAFLFQGRSVTSSSWATAAGSRVRTPVPSRSPAVAGNLQ